MDLSLAGGIHFYYDGVGAFMDRDAVGERLYLGDWYIVDSDCEPPFGHIMVDGGLVDVVVFVCCLARNCPTPRSHAARSSEHGRIRWWTVSGGKAVC